MINERQTRYIKERKKKNGMMREIQVRWSGILTPHWVLIGECTSFPSCTTGFNLVIHFLRTKDWKYGSLHLTQTLGTENSLLVEFTKFIVCVCVWCLPFRFLNLCYLFGGLL